MTESKRPLVTVALFSYNQAHYVGEAIASVLAQDYSPLEIILSDDCSTDETFMVMQQAAKMYCGPHKVILNRNSINLNLGDHVNAVGRLALGELIVLAAGDDVSMPNRTTELVARWLAIGHPTAVLYSDFEAMDFESNPSVLQGEAVFRGLHKSDDMARGCVRVLGATTAVTKDIFTRFPPIHPSVRHEDRVLPFRALLLGGTIAFVDQKLVRYRVQGGMSRYRASSGRDFLYHYVADSSVRTLPDAVQRLSDLTVVSPSDASLHKACNATIANHHAWIELTSARGFVIDKCMVKWLSKGARPGPLLKLYLKARFIVIFNFYYRKRFVK